MLRKLIFATLAAVTLISASPARERYHWYPAAGDNRPRPWAVMLPRAAGIGKLAVGNQYVDLAGTLKARGIDVLIIDYDAAMKRVATTGGIGPRIVTIVTDALADARADGRMDMRCSGLVIGWSRGGEGALTLASVDEGGRTGIKAAIVYYPSVRGQPQPFRQLHPVLALQGAGDSTAPAAKLQKLAANRQPSDIEFELRLFPGAKHRFDVARDINHPETANPVQDDYDPKAAAEALGAISGFLDRHDIGPGGCALD
jgi:dienelactone hydrolase